jgi:hypothetical protein
LIGDFQTVLADQASAISHALPDRPARTLKEAHHHGAGMEPDAFDVVMHLLPRQLQLLVDVHFFFTSKTTPWALMIRSMLAHQAGRRGKAINAWMARAITFFCMVKLPDGASCSCAG